MAPCSGCIIGIGVAGNGIIDSGVINYSVVGGRGIGGPRSVLGDECGSLTP